MTSRKTWHQQNYWPHFVASSRLFRKAFPDYLLDINWLSPVDLVVFPLLRPPKIVWLIDWLIDWLRSLAMDGWQYIPWLVLACLPWSTTAPVQQVQTPERGCKTCSVSEILRSCYDSLTPLVACWTAHHIRTVSDYAFCQHPRVPTYVTTMSIWCITFSLLGMYFIVARLDVLTTHFILRSVLCWIKRLLTSARDVGPFPVSVRTATNSNGHDTFRSQQAFYGKPN